jgi:hypothetical protein
MKHFTTLLHPFFENSTELFHEKGKGKNLISNLVSYAAAIFLSRTSACVSEECGMRFKSAAAVVYEAFVLGLGGGRGESGAPPPYHVLGEWTEVITGISPMDWTGYSSIFRLTLKSRLGGKAVLGIQQMHPV